MASAKFLEEALATDVDESAVSALVGSLETQLVSASPASVASTAVGAPSQQPPTQNHVNNGVAGAGQVVVAAQPQQKFGVANGGVASQASSVIPTSVAATTAATTVNLMLSAAADMAMAKSLALPASGYLNQVCTSSATMATSTIATSSMASQQQQSKPMEALKIVYSPGTQPMSSPATVNLNVNSRLNQVTTSLPNGNLGMSLPLVTAQSVMNPGAQVVTGVPTQTGAGSRPLVGVGKAAVVASTAAGMTSLATAPPSLLIKTSAASSVAATSATGVVSVPMTLATAMVSASAAQLAQMTPAVTTTSGMSTAMTGVPGTGGTTVVTLTPKMTSGPGGMVTAAGTTPVPATTVIPAGPLQILNMNAVRPAGALQGTAGAMQGQVQGQKTLAPRVVIAPPQMMRPGQPGQITLQTLQHLQPGTQGTLLLKTENGQYQIIRVSPAPPQPQPQLQPQLQPTHPQPQTPTTLGTTLSSPSGNSSTIPGTTPYRLQSIPAGPVAMTTSTAVTSVGAHLPTATPTAVVTPNATAITASTTVAAAQTATAQMSPETAKIKCKKFLANLLELSGKQPEQVARNVRNLIQGLIDGKVESEEFCNKLQRELNSQPQPCLVGFLKKSLPHLRLSLANKELAIEGIKPPSPSSVTNVLATSGVVTPIQQNQVRSQTMQTQMRIVSPMAATSGVVSALPRHGQIMQPRTITPVRPQVTIPAKMVTPVRPHQHHYHHHPQQHQQQQPQLTVPMTMVTSPSPTVTHTPACTIPTLTTATSAAAMAAAVAAAGGGVGGGGGGTLGGSVAGNVASILSQVQAKQQSIPSPLVLPPSTPLTTTIPKQLARDRERKATSSAAAAAAAAAAAVSAGYSADDDINDVAAMGGVNLAEETQRILGSTEFVGTQIRSCKDEMFLFSTPLQARIKEIAAKHNLEEPLPEVAALISHATQERLKSLVSKLAVIAEHRLDIMKMDPRYESTQDVKGQLKFLEELDKLEKKRHEEQEREMLLRAAKSRSKSEDPEQAKLKAKAKEMQRAEMEEMRQREANLTALQAIGPRKKPRLDFSGSPSSHGQGSTGSLGGLNPLANRPQLPLRPRVKRVNLRDLLFLLEQEPETTRSNALYRGFLK